LLQFHVGCVFSGDETARSQDTSECEKKHREKLSLNFWYTPEN